MPYVITTKQERATARTANGRELELHEGRSFKGWAELTSHAVATLDEARAAAQEAITRHLGTDTSGPAEAMVYPERQAIDALTEQGGSIGPLPDGTVIEVEPVSRLDLVRRLAQPIDSAAAREEWEVIADFNAGQEV